MSTLLSVAEARQRLVSAFSPLSHEVIDLSQAYGRILAAEIVSPHDFPLFANSSMDGFAVRAEDVRHASSVAPVPLKVIADVAAGQVSSVQLNEQQAIRIMTGAPLPEGADAVVPIEDTDQYQSGRQPDASVSSEVKVYKPVNEGDYVRLKGQDIRAGEIVLAPERKIRAQEVGFLAMLGIAQVPVFRRPRVAILSTGDELLPVTMPLSPGKIHESNAYSISALVDRDGGVAENLGILPDRVEAIEGTLDRAVTNRVDMILSSAGVSVGAFDYMRQVVEKNGQLDFWRVNMRPGKPIAFGTYRGVPFVGLPGNPVSAFIGFEVFVSPAIKRMTGLPDLERTRVRARLTHALESDGRESYLRAILIDQGGHYRAHLTGHQGSGNLRSLTQANALLIIPSGVKSLPANTEVEAWII